MFIIIEHGDNENLVANPNCPIHNLSDYIISKCKLPKKTIVDLTDENATLMEMYTKDPLEDAGSLFQARNTYLLCTIELNDDKTVRKITPMLNEWEKKYPFLDRKLRYRDKKSKFDEDQFSTQTKEGRNSLTQPVPKGALQGKKSTPGKKKKK